jgi:hypothetical protein
MRDACHIWGRGGQPYFTEAIGLARSAGDQWSLCQIFSHQATASVLAGDPVTAVAAAEEGRDIADALGDGFISRNCRTWMGLGLMHEGRLAHANRVVGVVAEEAEAASDLTMMVYSHVARSIVLACQGQAAAAHAAAQSGWAAAEAMGGVAADTAAAVFAYAALAGGDATAARQAAEEAFQQTNPMRETFTRSVTPAAEATLACGDLVTARRWLTRRSLRSRAGFRWAR